MNENKGPSQHWADEDLLNRLYGLAPAAGQRESHLTECATCAARWRRLLERRARVTAMPLPDAQLEDRLRAQRHALWQRIDVPRHSRLWRAVPAGATTLVVLLALALHTPAPQADQRPGTTFATISDTQFFSEIASVVNEDPSTAAEPVRALFSDSASVEAQ